MNLQAPWGSLRNPSCTRWHAVPLPRSPADDDGCWLLAINPKQSLNTKP